MEATAAKRQGDVAAVPQLREASSLANTEHFAVWFRSILCAYWCSSTLTHMCLTAAAYACTGLKIHDESKGVWLELSVKHTLYISNERVSRS